MWENNGIQKENRISKEKSKRWKIGGITLISLVITILILIILSSITIGAIFG